MKPRSQKIHFCFHAVLWSKKVKRKKSKEAIKKTREERTWGKRTESFDVWNQNPPEGGCRGHYSMETGKASRYMGIKHLAGGKRILFVKKYFEVGGKITTNRMRCAIRKEFNFIIQRVKSRKSKLESPYLTRKSKLSILDPANWLRRFQYKN